MLQKIIKYGGLALVVVGIFLVMKNLFKNNDEWKDVKNKTSKGIYYSASISLLDSDTDDYISGASLKVTDKDGFVVSEWTTGNGSRLITNLENGSYKLEEVSAADGYSTADSIEFVINGKDSDVVMMNSKGGTSSASTTESLGSGSSNNGSKAGSEVGVESTASSKSIMTFILGISLLNIGALSLLKKLNIM